MKLYWLEEWKGLMYEIQSHTVMYCIYVMHDTVPVYLGTDYTENMLCMIPTKGAFV